MKNVHSALAIAALLGCASCWNASFTLGQDSTAQAPDSPTPAPTTDFSHTVCNPFGGDRQHDAGLGLKGQMRYLETADISHGTNLQGFLDFGHLIDTDIYMNDVNVPTRAFDEGFVTEAQSYLRNQNNEVIDEYFSLHLQSHLALADTDAPGNYQLAVLSDDGATLSLQDNTGTFHEMAKNPTTTSTRLACATVPVPMSAAAAIPMNFEYFQGPRYHIALMILWRPWPTNPADVADPLCGVASTANWFDVTTHPSTPRANFIALQSRGWKVLEPGNFLLDSDAANPCAQ